MKISILSVLLFSLVFVRLNAQHDHSGNAANGLEPAVTAATIFEEQELRKKMKNDGLTDAVIEKLIQERKLFLATGRKTKWVSYGKSSSIGTNAACDLGVENGWNSWSGAPGVTNGSTGIPTMSTSISPPVSNGTNTCFTITSGSGIDPCTPGAGPGAPAIPMVSPGFGNNSIQMGCSQSAGCYAEQLTYAFTPTVQDTNFVYSYAMVLYDPGSSHTVKEQPFVQFMILAQNGDTVPCTFQKYVSFSSLPGFYTANATCTGGASVIYKPWSTVGVNLSAYIGQTLTAVITNVDCAQCGHFAHSYWDFICGSIPLNNGCNGSQSTICAASDPSIAYTYQWYKNGTILPASTTQCIAVTQNTGDVYVVHVMQPSGCNFYMKYVATPGAVQSLYTYSLNGNTVTFTNLSTGATSYVWNYGDGNTGTQSNPVYTYTNPGTYTVCLVATDGVCSDTVCKTITISVVGISEQDLASSLALYPSPVASELFLNFGKINFGKARISICNMIGEMLFETTIPANGEQRLNVSQLSNGVYFLKVNTEYGNITKEFTISKD